MIGQNNKNLFIGIVLSLVIFTKVMHVLVFRGSESAYSLRSVFRKIFSKYVKTRTAENQTRRDQASSTTEMTDELLPRQLTNDTNKIVKVEKLN